MFTGIDIAPYWRVLPEGAPDDPATRGPRMQTLRQVPSDAFGLGTHPTTQLCLLAIGAFAAQGVRARTVLDFGAGTGVLAIAAALSLQPDHVEAVEIDQQALRDAATNAELNGVRVDFRETLSEPARPHDLVVANILSAILLSYAEPLCARVAATGKLVLSGLVATDVPQLSARCAPLLPKMRSQVFARDAWRALVFAPHS